MISGMASGEPAWLGALDRSAASMLAGHGGTAAVVLAIALALIATGLFLPAPGARVAIILAAFVAAAIWVVGENSGAIFTGTATDPIPAPSYLLLPPTGQPDSGRGRRASRLHGGVPDWIHVWFYGGGGPRCRCRTG